MVLIELTLAIQPLQDRARTLPYFWILAFILRGTARENITNTVNIIFEIKESFHVENAGDNSKLKRKDLFL
jgi:hypothetical protein